MNTVLHEAHLPGGTVLQLVQGDLTAETVDAIVNAANRHLSHGGGIAGAIVRRGGFEIQRESDAWVHAHGVVSHAVPAYTGAGKLPCRYVIHAVGPVWGEGDEDHKLSQAVHGSLQVADTLKLQSLSLPAISTGIFGFPKERAARIILATITDYFSQSGSSSLQQIRIVLYDEPTLSAFLAAWQALGFDKAA